MTEWFEGSEAEADRNEKGNLNYVKALEVAATVMLRGGYARRVVQVLLEDGKEDADMKKFPKYVTKELLRAKEMLFSVIKLQQQELIFARSHISPTLSSDEAAYELLSHLGVNFALSSQSINLLETTLAPKVNVPELLSDPMTRSCGHSHIDNVLDYVELADLVATSLPTHFLPEGQKSTVMTK